MAANSAISVLKLKEEISMVIDKHSEELYTLSQEIWCNPELKFEERKAHACLTSFLEYFGFDVSRSFQLETAFRAQAGSKAGGLTVGIMCEYDALPEIGHACGHNLIAEAAVAASLGLKHVLESNDGLGQVVILGTPAEEGGGGKIKLIQKGCFDEMDFCLMVHPLNENNAWPKTLARRVVVVTYTGKAAHAAAYPWEGINALDAAVMAYNSLSVLRQQLKPTWRVHGVITEGGVKPNIIPERSQLYFYLRAPTKKELDVLTEKSEACFKAAAVSTGCSIDISSGNSDIYLNVIPNRILSQAFQDNAEQIGVCNFVTESKTLYSTDMGNVSYHKPSIHPTFRIGIEAGIHTREFQEAAGTRTAHEATLKAAKSMAMAAVDVLCNPEMMVNMQEEFEASILEQS